MIVKASAAPKYLGKPEYVDPEEALVAAISSCHMLTFLAICARRGIVVERYDDDAIGWLEPNEQRRLAITRVVLKPVVPFAAGQRPDANSLAQIHEESPPVLHRQLGQDRDHGRRVGRTRGALMARGWSLVLCAVLAVTSSVRAEEAPPALPSATSLLQEAEGLLDKNQPKPAVEAATKAVKLAPDNPNAWFVLARADHAAGDLDGAIKAGHQAAEFPAVRASAFYNLACAYALKGDKDDAFRALLGAKRAGFADRDLMASDPDLKSLQSDPRFLLPLARNYFVLKLKDNAELPFSVDLPVAYDPAKSYPVLIAPGHGKKVEGNWGGLFWGEDTCSADGSRSRVPRSFDRPDRRHRAMLDEVARRYKVEGNKFHVACYGPTSGPAFGAAMAYPERFKCLIAIPGAPATDQPDQLKKLRGIRVSFIVGEHDGAWRPEVEVANSRLKTAGVESYLEVVPGANHLLQEMFGGEFAERLELLR
jgi:tetratricopeptide (TPR) repeat protein